MLFVSAEGFVRAEDVSPYKAQVECEDGNHPITNRSIHRDASRRLPAVMVVWQGLKAPEGEPDPATVSEATLLETDYTKLHKQKPMVSKRWVRSLVRGLKVFMLMLMLTAGTALGGYFLYVLVVVL